MQARFKVVKALGFKADNINIVGYELLQILSESISDSGMRVCLAL